MRRLRQRRCTGSAGGRSEQGARPADQASCSPIRRHWIGILRRSLERNETCAGHEIVLMPIGCSGKRDPVIVDVTVTPLEGQVTGTHLLLELADARTRQRITRESEMLSRLDGSRLMIRQLGARDQKSARRTARRGAIARSRVARRRAQGIHHRHHQRGGSPARAGGQHAGALAPAAEGRRSTFTSCASTCFTCCAARRRRASRSIATTIRACRAALFDRNEIIQALLNVARNALQAVDPDGGHITLRTRVLSNINIGTSATGWWPISRSRTTATAYRRSCIAACSIRWSPVDRMAPA